MPEMSACGRFPLCATQQNHSLLWLLGGRRLTLPYIPRIRIADAARKRGCEVLLVASFGYLKVSRRKR
jgi:hypothetical protein